VGEGGLVDRFLEKPEGQEIVNIGYMVANYSLFEYLEVGGSLEDKPLVNLAQDNLLAAHNHDGFWQPMDTIRELEILNRHWNSGLVPWQNIQPAR
jgi:glucose-1-phosphate cytidylyltransferase